MAMASSRRNDRGRRPAASGVVMRNEAATHEVEVSRALNQWAVTVTSLADNRMITQDFFSRRWEAVARAEDFVRLLNRVRAPSRLVAGSAGLQGEQPALARQPAAVAADGAAGADDAMARHHDRDRIGSERIADRAGAPWRANPDGDVAVARHRPVRDPGRPPEHLAGEVAGERPVEGHVEVAELAGEVPSSSRRTGSRRRGASRMRGDRRVATSPSTSSRFSFSKAMRTSPLRRAMSSRVPIGLSMVVTATSTSPFASARSRNRLVTARSTVIGAPF